MVGKLISISREVVNMFVEFLSRYQASASFLNAVFISNSNQSSFRICNDKLIIGRIFSQLVAVIGFKNKLTFLESKYSKVESNEFSFICGVTEKI